MTTSSSVPENRYHVRSISLPSQSHPSSDRIEEGLVKLRNWEKVSTSATSSLKAEEICRGLSILGEVYICVEDLLCLPFTHQEHEETVNEVLDESIRLLDMCTTSRDILSSMKEHVQNLQSALRRRRTGELSMENDIHAYMCFRKKVKKDAAKGLTSLKRMNAKSASSNLNDMDQNLSMVIKVLREVIVITISVLQSLLTFVSTPRLKTKKSTWSIISKVMRKGQVACAGSHEASSEVMNVDDALYALCQNTSSTDNAKTVQSAQKELKALEANIECIDAGLESLFRHLIQTRVSILNNRAN